MKKLLIIAVVIVVVLVVGAFVAILNLGRIIEAGVEKGGSMVLGVPVTLDEAQVSLRGSVGLNGLAMGSPEGFQASEMFKLGRGQVDAKVMSFLSDEIVVRNVLIDGAEVTLELSDGKANWVVLMERLRRKAEPGAQPQGEAEKEVRSKKMRIEHIVFQNGKVHLAGIPMAGTATIPLPRVELRDIGQNGEGKSLPDTLLQIVKELYPAMLQAADDVLPAEQMKKLTEDVSGLIEDATGRIGESGAEAGRRGREAVEEAVGGAAEKAKDALGGLMGGGDDED